MKDLLAPHSDRMLALCREVARDTTAPESLMARALGLVRDLALTQGDLGGQVDWLEDLLARGRRPGRKTQGAWPAGRGQRQGG